MSRKATASEVKSSSSARGVTEGRRLAAEGITELFDRAEESGGIHFDHSRMCHDDSSASHSPLPPPSRHPPCDGNPGGIGPHFPRGHRKRAGWPRPGGQEAPHPGSARRRIEKRQVFPAQNARCRERAAEWSPGRGTHGPARRPGRGWGAFESTENRKIGKLRHYRAPSGSRSFRTVVGDKAPPVVLEITDFNLDSRTLLGIRRRLTHRLELPDEPVQTRQLFHGGHRRESTMT